MLLATHQLQMERRERHRGTISVCAPPQTPATGGEGRERHRANQVDALAHTDTGGEERESRANQVLCARHTPAYKLRGERVIEPIKCLRSPHTSYRRKRRESHRDQSTDELGHHTNYRWRRRES